MNNVNNLEKRGCKCRVTCCVYGCDSRGSRNRKLRFHFFPKNARKVLFEKKGGEMELTDIRRLGLPGFLNLRLAKVSKFMKVCSLHFKLEAEIFSKYLSITG